MLNRRVHRAHSRPMFDRLTRFVATLVPRLKHDKQKRNYTTIIPVLRQRTDTPGSALVDLLGKNAILGAFHFFGWFETTVRFCPSVIGLDGRQSEDFGLFEGQGDPLID